MLCFENPYRKSAYYTFRHSVQAKLATESRRRSGESLDADFRRHEKWKIVVFDSGESILTDFYDIIVVGGGHAGCEAALAAARMGAETMLFNINLDSIALMSCNPAIGGLAKSQLVKEIDALGGEMGKITDRTAVHFRLLNASKGPAVQSTRMQCDKQSKTRKTCISVRPWWNPW